MSIPEGFKIVPAVATLEMKNAGWRECGRQGIEPEDIEMQTIWTAMHLEAPTPPQPIYDEAKERELFNAWYAKNVGVLGTPVWAEYIGVWLACAQSRAKAGEVGHE